MYTIVHVPSSLMECAEYWDSPRSVSTNFLVKMLLVMAAGYCFEKDGDDSKIAQLLLPI